MMANEKKKTAAIVLGLMVALTGSALTTPAEAAESNEDIDARIAAIEQQQQNLAAQLDKLKKENAELKKTKAIANSNRNAIKGIKAAADRIQFSGFGRVSYDNDNVKGYIDQNDNSRFYMDLRAKFKVNDRWNVNFQSETNPRWKQYVDTSGKHRYHMNNINGDSTDRDKEDGSIQRLWVDGSVGKVNFNVGRQWRGFGFQNIFLGNETDGIVVDTQIPKTNLTGQAFWVAPTDKGYNFNAYGVGFKGTIGHGLQLQGGFAQINKGKNDAIGTNYYSSTTTGGDLTGTATLASGAQLNLWGHMADGQWQATKDGDSSINFQDIGGNFRVTPSEWGPDGNPTAYTAKNDWGTLNIKGGQVTGQLTGADGKPITVDTSNLKITPEVTTYDPYRNSIGRHALFLSAMWNLPIRNLYLIGDWVHTYRNSYTDTEYVGNRSYDVKYNKKDTYAVRLNYRWTDLNSPGSFQLYGRWFDYPKNENDLVGMFGDKEWGAFQPGSKGWVLGFKYVPARNIEWETFYEVADTYDKVYGRKDHNYDRRLLRTQVDYHF